jgi:hypothetical protein
LRDRRRCLVRLNGIGECAGDLKQKARASFTAAPRLVGNYPTHAVRSIARIRPPAFVFIKVCALTDDKQARRAVGASFPLTVFYCASFLVFPVGKRLRLKHSRDAALSDDDIWTHFGGVLLPSAKISSACASCHACSRVGSC